MIKLNYTKIAQALDLQTIEEEIKRLNDLKKRIENYSDDENKNHYDYEYSIISNLLKNGYHIRAFYVNIEPTYILYYKTNKLIRITSQCFTRLITNLEWRYSGRPSEECYVWKD